MQLEGQKQLCPNCQKLIYKANYQLHSFRCQGKSQSRIKFSKLPSQNHRKSQRSGYRPSKIDEHKMPTISMLYANLEESDFKEKRKKMDYSNIKKSEIRQDSKIRQKSRIQNSSIKSKISQIDGKQKIPCNFCGYLQSLQELDTHPEICPNREVKCIRCGDIFPMNLIEEHEELCSSKNKSRRSVFSKERQRQRERQKQRERQQKIKQNGQSQLIQLSDVRGNRRRRVNPLSEDSQIRRLIANISRYEQGNEKQVLSEQDIMNLNAFFYKPRSIKNDNCCICYCQYQEYQQLLLLPCCHLFHAQCVKEWLRNNIKCPVCKQKAK